MPTPSTSAGIAAGLAMAGWCAVLLLRDRAPGRRTLVALVVVEAVLLAQLVVALVLAVRGEPPAEGAVFVAYAVVCVLTLPAGALWAASERTRSGTAVLLVACLVVPVLVLRMQQTWVGPGG